MISSSDKTVLQETYHSSKKEADRIQAVLGKVYDDDLAYDLSSQLKKYKSINEKATEQLVESGIMPEKNVSEKALLWSSVQMNTLLNTSTEHIANMMIRSNAKGIVGMMTTLKDNKNAQKEAYELASELMDFEEEAILQLKSYL